MKHACIIGFGAIGPVHAASIQQTPSALLYGVCDVDRQKLEKARAAYPDVKTFQSFNEVLEDPAIDTVHICTPHHLHALMACSALSAGKDVVLEKPVCLNEQELSQIKRTLNVSGRRLCVMFQNRTNPCF